MDSLPLRFNGHFPGEPGLAGVYWSKGWWKWWWQLELQDAQNSGQIVTTNKPIPNFLQAGCPSCRPTNRVKALEEKYHIMDSRKRYFYLLLQTTHLTLPSREEVLHFIVKLHDYYIYFPGFSMTKAFSQHFSGLEILSFKFNIFPGLSGGLYEIWVQLSGNMTLKTAH